ncbi:MAG: hypothetical protein IKX33_06005 [Prevotella sp.]|nr:hypothetical protein [Prevotella sp.]
MKKITLMLMGVFMLMTSLEVKAEVDPNFHIYICFGQSNMEGNAQWESQDVGNVDSRFQMLATCNFDSPKRTLGNWYTATCPIVSPQGKLGPTDYFGRTMVANLPDHKIGVIAVAMGGSPIEMFDKDKYQQKLADNPNEWWAQLSKWYYGGNPYGRIIEMAKKAQEVGVIKGILLHQGCSNCGDPNWPNMVNKIYNDMLNDLGLQAADVPLFVGEVEYQNMGGGCSSHNVQVDRMPSVIPTAHVVSAKYLPGNGNDPWHFSAQGYRLFGQRYAQIALSVIYGLDINIDQPTVPATPKAIDRRFTVLTDIKTTHFAIVNEADHKALYGRYEQHLGYDDFDQAFAELNSGYLFKLSRTSGGFRLRLVTPEGNDYVLTGDNGYLNSQDVDGTCCFIGGVNSQNGQDIPKGAAWDIQYVEGKGFTIKNVGTGKYLKTNDTAKYDEPTYFTLCTLKDVTSGVNERGIVNHENMSTSTGWYTLDGRHLKENPTQRGLYIFKGKKVLIK